MFGSSTKSSGMFGGESSSSSSQSILPTFQEEPACAKMCPQLSYQQRIIGFVGCAALGYVLSLVGTLTLIGGPTTANIRIFACLYVFGNIIALCATGFLLGPKSQCTKMWAVTRRYSTAFYLFMLIIVFVVAVLKQSVWLVLFLLFIEVLAAVWYSASFVPFGRKIILAFLRQIGICFPCFFIYDSVHDATQNKSTTSSVFGGSNQK
eukprot:gene5403-7487_t